MPATTALFVEHLIKLCLKKNGVYMYISTLWVTSNFVLQRYNL